jgi:hypothetical protein
MFDPMQRVMNKRFLMILALLVGLLPFGLSFGFTSLAGEGHTLSQSHSDRVDCADMAHSGDCVGMSADAPLHDDCCSDHCDSSFGSQLCAGTEYSFELPSGHLFQSYGIAQVTDPVPTTLLRPPQILS